MISNFVSSSRSIVIAVVESGEYAKNLDLVFRRLIRKMMRESVTLARFCRLMVINVLVIPTNTVEL